MTTRDEQVRIRGLDTETAQATQMTNTEKFINANSARCNSEESITKSGTSQTYTGRCVDVANN
jgi:hypothetical protein